MTWFSAILIVTLGWAPSPGDPSGPRVAVDPQQHNFGRVGVGVTGRHVFVFTNTGDEPLVLTRGESSCGCCTCVCAVRLPQGAIAPGRSAEVTLEWKSKSYVGSFRQTATILTNDPNRRKVRLLVTGRFTGPVGVLPSQLSFGSVRAGRTATRVARLFSYLDKPLQLTGCKLSNPHSAKYFEVTWEPLAAEQVREEGEARGGYSVHVSVRPDLPVGEFRQQMLLKTNSQKVPIIEVPVHGQVVSDISIVGRGWNAQTGTLSMGTVRGSQGTAWPLMIVVRGAHAKDVGLRPVRIVPDLLKVQLGAPRYIDEKSISLTHMKIRIPPGSGPFAPRGPKGDCPGRIVLQTNHPEIPELTVRVRFVIKE